MNRKILRYTAIIFFAALMPGAGSPDEDMFREISAQNRTGKKEQAVQMSLRFLREHRTSPRIPHVKIILAENEKKPEAAVKAYRSIIAEYRNHPGRELARAGICEIYFLQSNWDSLEAEAREGLRSDPSGPFYDRFARYYVISCIRKGRYSEAGENCRSLMERTREYENLAELLLILSHISEKTTGLSRSYIYSLRELLLGFPDSKVRPSALFLLGNFYHSLHDYDRAYSAYTEIISRYPHSPEALYASGKNSGLKQYSPKKVSFLPDADAVKQRDEIDISPEFEIEKTDSGAMLYYVAIGPFSSTEQALEIKKVVLGVSEAKLVRLHSGYMLYAGEENDINEIMKVKIRLAEELGINGSVVRSASFDNRRYIYGD